MKMRMNGREGFRPYKPKTSVLATMLDRAIKAEEGEKEHAKPQKAPKEEESTAKKTGRPKAKASKGTKVGKLAPTPVVGKPKYKRLTKAAPRK